MSVGNRERKFRGFPGQTFLNAQKIGKRGKNFPAHKNCSSAGISGFKLQEIGMEKRAFHEKQKEEAGIQDWMFFP